MTVNRTSCPARRHGDAAAYSWWRCRCPDAREAHRLSSKRHREGRAEPKFVGVTGTARRLQGLVTLGYGWEYLGQRLDVTRQRVIRLALCVNPRVHVDTAMKVRALFEELSATPAPAGSAAKKARSAAARRGYLPPLAWDDIDDPNSVPVLDGDGDDIVDDEVIRRVLAGQLPFKALRDAEKVALFRDHLADWSYNPIMALLGMSARTVKLWRERVADSERVAA